MRRSAVIALSIAAACSGRGPQAVGSQPSWRGSAQVSSDARPVTFAPAGQPAIHYNEPVRPPPRSALGDAVIAAVRDQAAKSGTQTPVADARLFRACSELAAVVPEEGIIAYSLVEFALQRNGIIEPSPHLLVVWGDLDSPQLIVEQLAPRLAEILEDGATARLGIGAVKRMPDGTGAVVFALQGSGVTTAPIPRTLKAQGAFTLDAQIEKRYRDPEVFITRNTGATDRIELRATPGGFTAPIACGPHVGKQQIEITASDTQGSTVLANFPIWCGAEPPVSFTVEPSLEDAPISDAGEAEKRLLALVNRDRVAAGLPGLLWDDKVAEVARGHSTEMRRTKLVAHISPTTGSAADRVRAAKIKTAVVLENVARAYGIGEAHQGLMNSPGHRSNLMSRAATHVGIGVVFGEQVSGRREIFITQVFTRVPPKVDNTRAADEVRRKLASVHASVVDPSLTAIAQELAAGLAAGQTREQAYAPIRARVDTLGKRYARVGSIITAAADLDTIDGPAILGDAKPDDIGIGVAQGTHPEIGEGAMWIVVLVANKR